MSDIRVRKLPRNPGPAAWNAILPEPGPVLPVDGEMSTDWIVVGAGLTGLATARRLSKLRAGERIAVLDAVRVGEGPAGRNSGFMIDLPHDLASDDYGGALKHDKDQIKANRIAINFALDAAQEYGMPEEAIVRSGKMNAAATERGLAHNRSYAAHLDGLKESYALMKLLKNLKLIIL